MRSSIQCYSEDPKSLNKNARTVIGNTSFDQEEKDKKGNYNTTYYVVHSGETDSITGQRVNEKNN